MKRSRSFRNWLSLSTAFVVLLSSCGGVTEHNETTTDTTIQPDKAVELFTLQLKDPDPVNVLPALFPKGTYDATDQTIIWMPEGEAALYTGAARLSSARVVRCWVKSRNERNPRV